jgi:hypothetical protein
MMAASRSRHRDTGARGQLRRAIPYRQPGSTPVLTGTLPDSATSYTNRSDLAGHHQADQRTRFRSIRPLYSADMWTAVLATYAAVVSTSSLAISYLSYRSGGPQLSGDAEIEGRYDIQGPTLYVDLHNRGRGPITVDSIMLWGVGIALKKKSLPVAGWPLRSPSCVLPSRIEGHSGAHWHFPAHDVAKEWLNRHDLAGLKVTISLATGKTLTLNVDTSNIDVLDGRNLPDWQPDYFKDWPKLPERQPPSGETSDRSPATSAEIKPSRTANELDL